MVSVPIYRKCKHCGEVFSVATVNQYSDKPRSTHIFCSQNCRHCYNQMLKRQDPDFLKKKAIIIRDRYRWKNKKESCQKCGSKENLEIHHITYFENPNKIIVLCRKCHRSLHKKEKEEINNA